MFTPIEIIAEANRILGKTIKARNFGRRGLNIDGEVVLRAPQGYGYAASLSWFYVVVEQRFSYRAIIWKTRVKFGPGWQVELEAAIHVAQARAKAQEIEDKAKDSARRKAENARREYAEEISKLLGGVPACDYRIVRGEGLMPVGYKWEGNVLGDAATVAKKLRAIEAIAAATDLPLAAPITAMLPAVKAK
jgi:alkanesulfonate monooxygenase SsuD/methylene tetrahydromethanopterin reductase-like flavin-dependent oxidoreductase (luciferase family)